MEVKCSIFVGKKRSDAQITLGFLLNLQNFVNICPNVYIFSPQFLYDHNAQVNWPVPNMYNVTTNICCLHISAQPRHNAWNYQIIRILFWILSTDWDISDTCYATLLPHSDHSTDYFINNNYVRNNRSHKINANPVKLYFLPSKLIWYRCFKNISAHLKFHLLMPPT
jgi:hypothetical protein